MPLPRMPHAVTKPWTRRIALSACCLALSACSTDVYYFADAGHNDVYYGEIARQQAVMTLRVDATFYDNGKLRPDAEPALLAEVYRVLGKLGVVTVSTDPNTPAVLSIEVRDQHGDDEGGTQMFLSGATMGQVSAQAKTDRYEFTITYRTASGAERFGRYRHSIWATAGAHPPKPSDRGPYSAEDAISVVIEDVLLQFFKDLQGTSDDADGVMYVPDPK